MHATRERIRLIVADIDGCLSRGSSNPFSPELIARLIGANNRSRVDANVPAITFCTGRPQPYVECLIQVTHGYMPALCESGLLMFDPVRHAVKTHPGFTEHHRAVLGELREMIQREIISDDVVFEPGKLSQITLLVALPLTPMDIFKKAQRIGERFGGEIAVELARICVHFLFRDMNKGTGVRWLSNETGIPLGQMAGMGDASPDLPFLALLPVTCAPGEAPQEVKAVCSFVSSKCDAEAAVDFVDHVIACNRTGSSGS